MSIFSCAALGCGPDDSGLCGAACPTRPDKPADTRLRIEDQNMIPGLENFGANSGTQSQAASHYAVGLALSEAGETKRAMKAFEKAIRLDGSHGMAWYQLGCLYAECQELDKGLKSLNRAMTLLPDEAYVPYDMAFIFLEQGDLRKAAKAFKKVVRLNPEDVESWMNLANTLRQIGELDQAIGAYESGLAYDTSSAMAHYNLGTAYLEKYRVVDNTAGEDTAEKREGKEQVFQRAIVHFNRAIDLQDGDYPDALFNLAVANQDIGDWNSAAQCYERILELNSGNEEAKQALKTCRKKMPPQPAATAPSTLVTLNSLNAAPTLLPRNVSSRRSSSSSQSSGNGNPWSLAD